MIAQAVIVQDGRVLMVRQLVKRGDLVWNFPGGGVEPGETFEAACVREVKEETGYDVEIEALLLEAGSKRTYVARIAGGEMRLDRSAEANRDILEVAWVPIGDAGRLDRFTLPVLELYASRYGSGGGKR